MAKLTARDYFEELKTRKNHINDEILEKIYNNAYTLLAKAVVTGQHKAAKKLMFQVDTISREKQIIDMGYDTFLYQDDIDRYIDEVADDTVKIIDLEKFEREIPDEIALKIKETKNIFDKFYVLFTDYTHRVEKEIVKERDPILFGTFQDINTSTIVDRFYFIGDWEDEYCDLTLDKMVSQYKHKNGQDIIRKISLPMTIDELREQVNNITVDKNGRYIQNSVSKKKKLIRHSNIIFSYLWRLFTNENKK